MARRDDRLRALASGLGADGRAVACVQADLATEQGVADVARALDERGEPPTLFVNNAGVGLAGVAHEAPTERVVQMLRLNVEAVTRLSLEAARRMVRAGRGGIINVASTAAFQPVPGFAVYAATKGYELLFTEALNDELRGTGVRAFALCPGHTVTEFQAVAGLTRVPPAAFVATAEQCVRRGLDAFDAGRSAAYIDGAPNAALQIAQRLLPRAWVTRISGGMNRGTFGTRRM